MSEKICESKCQNPFHYLRRHVNLSTQRPSKCPCRNVIEIKKVYANQPITEFVFKYSTENLSDFSDSKIKFRRNTTVLPTQNKLFRTRTDDIRRQHDRGKKRSYKQLIIHMFIAKKRSKKSS